MLTDSDTNVTVFKCITDKVRYTVATVDLFILTANFFHIISYLILVCKADKLL